MAIVRSFTNSFEVVDYTEELNVIPNQWGTINNLGLFQSEPVAEHTVAFEEITYDGALIVDRVRGDRANVNKDATRKIHTFAVPHFPLADAIYPQDIQGKRAYGSNNAEVLAGVRTRKMERIRQNHAWTLEAARAQLLTAGTVYAPSGTVTQNWFTEFGVTQKTVDFVFATATTEMLAKCEEVIAHMQDNAGNGGMITGVIGLCSATFFAQLIKHQTVKQAYQYYTSTQEIMRKGGRDGAGAMHREFDFGGIRFIEMRDTYNGAALIPSQDCVFVPTGTDAFKTYFSPANRFDLVNTLGEEVYMFEKMDADGTQYTIDTESNFVNAAFRPATIVRGFY